MRTKMKGGINMNKENKILTPINCVDGCHKVEVPSEDEVAALDAMRTIKNRVREIKRDISELTEIEKGKTIKRELENEMIGLRAEWKEWENKREEAARVRMILLGHEEP
jgi:hypothetical protein